MKKTPSICGGSGRKSRSTDADNTGRDSQRRYGNAGRAAARPCEGQRGRAPRRRRCWIAFLRRPIGALVDSGGETGARSVRSIPAGPATPWGEEQPCASLFKSKK